MSNRDIGKLYSDMVTGNGNHNHVIRESNLYSSVYEVHNESFEVVDQLGAMDTGEYKAFFLTNEGWKGVRLTKLQVEEMYEEAESLTDKGELIEKIKEIAAKSSIIFDVAERSSSDVMRQLRKFVMDSGRLTKETFPDQYSDAIHAANTIMSIIESGQLQSQLIRFMDGVDHGMMFNLFNAAAPDQTSSLSIAFDLENNNDMLYMMPAGEARKARGAAGPGEALLSFIYGGGKPEGAGDIILSSGKNDTIELKYECGRVGKYISGGESVKNRINKLFVRKLEQVHQYYNGDSKTNPVHAVPFDNTYLPLSDIRAKAAETVQGEDGVTRPTPEAMKYLDLFAPINTPPERVAKINPKTANLKNKKAPKVILSNAKDQIAYGTKTLQTLTLQDFLQDYTGIKSKDGIPIDGPHSSPNYLSDLANTTVSDLIPSLPGQTPKQKIINLVGMFQLKNYLTHVQPFKWFVVYRSNGDGVCLTSEQIIKLGPLELLAELDKRELGFSVKDDASGYSIKFIT